MEHEASLALTPGFSQVLLSDGRKQPFQRFLAVLTKPSKRFDARALPDTQVMLGANEIRTLDPRPSYG